MEGERALVIVLLMPSGNGRAARDDKNDGERESESESESEGEGGGEIGSR